MPFAAPSELAHAENPPPARCPLRLALFEVVWIFLIFFLFSGSPPPDAGESHYLPKAKHYWNPAWCPGDLFLESYDVHLGFYWTFGWLTRFFSLDATTWILRVVLWGALAWAWQRLSWAILPRPLFSLLSAGLMLLLAEHFHLAKEILLQGGVEGKTAAYVGVLAALQAVVRNRWRLALLWTGGAGAMHVLVGGWTAIALGLAWLACGRQRPPIRHLGPAALAGLVLSLPGLVPPLLLLLRPQPPDAAEAYRIYVFDRLPHHLVFHRFPPWYLLRHAALLATGVWLAWRFGNQAGLRRLALVIAGAVAIAVVGIAIDQGLVIRANWLGQTLKDYQQAAAPLLRFYWFRVEDALVPVGVALGLTLIVARVQATRPESGQWLLIGTMLAAAANVADASYWRARLRVPGAVIQQHATEDTRLRWWWQRSSSERLRDDETPLLARRWEERLVALSAREHYAYWQAACHWITAHTPADAKFLTPRRQQTFKWNAGRAEVVTWKDIPQDPASILAWRDALTELYPNDPPHRRYDLAAFTDQELIRLARKYGCQYIVLERRWQARQIGLRRLYPLIREENPVFEVYQVPPAVFAPSGGG